MRFTWDEVKRKRNLKDHGLDFVDAPRVFHGATFTYEDAKGNKTWDGYPPPEHLRPIGRVSAALKTATLEGPQRILRRT